MQAAKSPPARDGSPDHVRSAPAVDRLLPAAVMPEVQVCWFEDEVWRGYLPTDSRLSLLDRDIFQTYIRSTKREVQQPIRPCVSGPEWSTIRPEGGPAVPRGG